MSSNTNSVGDQIKSGLKGIHGIGEAIRGTAMSETDKAFGTANRPGAAENEASAKQGVADMKRADDKLGHNHGVNSNTTTTTTTTGTGTAATDMSHGAHATAPGNIGVGSTGSGIGGSAAGAQEQPGVNQRF